MDERDYYPVYEKPMKKEFIESVLAAKKRKTSPTNIDEQLK